MGRYAGALILFMLAIMEMWMPGGNGIFMDKTAMSEEGVRIMVSVYGTGGLVLLFMPRGSS